MALTWAIPRHTSAGWYILSLNSSAGDSVGEYTIEVTDDASGTPDEVLAQFGDHVGSGKFVMSVSISDTIEATLFQAVSGDTDGDRDVGSFDIQNILAANLFGKGGSSTFDEKCYDGRSAHQLDSP